MNTCTHIQIYSWLTFIWHYIYVNTFKVCQSKTWQTVYIDIQCVTYNEHGQLQKKKRRKERKKSLWTIQPSWQHRMPTFLEYSCVALDTSKQTTAPLIYIHKSWQWVNDFSPGEPASWVQNRSSFIPRVPAYLQLCKLLSWIIIQFSICYFLYMFRHGLPIVIKAKSYLHEHDL